MKFLFFIFHPCGKPCRSSIMKKHYCAVSFYRYIYFRFKLVVLIITGWSLFFVSAFVLSYLLQSNVFFYLFYGLSNVVFVLPFIALFYGYRSARDTVLIDPFLRCKDFHICGFYS